MKLDDVMASDLASIAGATSDLGEEALFLPAENRANQIEIRIVFGDTTDGLMAMPEGTSDNRVAPACIQTGPIVLVLNRDPLPGDRIVMVDGPNAGEWSISQAVSDQGGACNVSLRLERMFAAGRVGAR